MSVGPLTDEVMTINVPMVGSAEFARGNFFMEWGVSDMLSTIEVSEGSVKPIFKRIGCRREYLSRKLLVSFFLMVIMIQLWSSAIASRKMKKRIMSMKMMMMMEQTNTKHQWTSLDGFIM